MLKIIETQKGGLTIYRLEGELVRETHRAFGKRVAELAEQGGGRIILDLWDLEFMDSFGIGALLGVNQAIRRKGGVIALYRMNPNIKRVLELVVRDSVFLTANSLHALLQHFARPA